jgi:hypothetical protein
MSDDSTAVVTPVPAQFRGRVLTGGNFWAAIGLFVLQIVLAIAAAAVPALLGVVAADHLFPKNLSFIPIFGGLGGMVGLMWFTIGWTLRHPWSSAYMFARTRAELAQRLDPVVDSNNPDAILVEVVPRRNWGHIGPGGTEDIGFLCLDAEHRQLLFEGDNKRYRIPVPALISSEVEVVNKNWEQSQRSAPVAMVILKFRERDGLGEREVPVRPMRAVSGDPLGGNYMERAEELQRRILKLSSLDPAYAP